MNYNVTPAGRLIWTDIVEPRADLSGRMVYQAGIELSISDSEGLMEILAECIKQARSTNPKFPADDKKLNVPYKPAKRKDDSGNMVVNPDALVWNFKRMAVRIYNGEEKKNPPPILYDASGAIVTGKVADIGRGTLGKVVFRTYNYARGAQAGIGFGLEGFQIIELAENASKVDLPPVAGGWTHEDAEAPAEATDLSSLFG